MIPQLFLMEFHIGKIYFEPTFTPIPTKDQITLEIRFSDVLKLDVNPVDIPFEEQNGTGETVEFNVGKSNIFFHKPRILLAEFKKPLEITLKVDRRYEGSAKFAWRDEFIETVKLLETIGMVKAVDYSGDMELKNKSELIGTFELFLRMSCFGEFIETQFQTRQLGETYEYIFRNPKTTNTFKCEKVGESEILPVVSLYSPCTRESESPDGPPFEAWQEVLGAGGKRSSTMIEIPFNGDPRTLLSEGIALSNLYGLGSIDTISMYFRPSEHKFYDLLNLMTAEVSTNDRGTSILFIRDRPLIQKKQDSGGVLVEKENGSELTADKITKKLCNNKDCPAVRKFKELGIGPLATGKGLGTLYKDVDPPIEYGMSQTYGTMSNYGPFGVFATPKRLDNASVHSENSQENNSEENGNIKTENQCPYTLRLRGGGPLNMDEAEGPKSPLLECKSVMDQMDEILRAYKKALGPCGESTCPYAQNLAEESCKKLCEHAKSAPIEATESGSCKSVPCNILECPFREATTKYPAGCGSPKCAYTKYKLGLTDDDADLELQFLPPAVSGKCGHPKCKYLLQPDLPPIHWDCPEPLPQGNCKNPNCPFQPPDLKKLKIPKPRRGPCGSLSCPYSIPPPCDAPTCPFRVIQCPLKDSNQEPTGQKSCCQQEPEEPDDCGDPECCEPKLKGEFTACGNPDCPFATKIIPKNDKNTCGKPECPFAPKPKDTQSCGNPNCSCCASKPKNTNYGDGDPNCPFVSKQKNSNTCDNPECPFAPKQKSAHSCGNPNCPFASKQKESNLCDNPECPFAPKQNDSSLCDNPDCPFASKQKDSNVCENPECPFASKPKDSNSCGDPNCPFSSKQKNSNMCDNPECPFASKQKDSNLCDNPECPFASKQKDPNSCGDPNCPFVSKQENSNLCDNPECPFAAKQKDSNTCDNPDCPFAAKQKDTNLCDNPDCPFATKHKDTNSCGDPSCPFASKPKDTNICDNPDCPFAAKAKDSSVCDNPDCPFASKPKDSGICDNPDCPFASKPKESNVCDNPDCPFASKPKDSGICDNPDCPFAEKKQKDVCDNPDCPFAKKSLNSEKYAKKLHGSNVCENPECPYQKKQKKSICDDPYCPYIQPLPSCGIPNCPYEPVPMVFCPAKLAAFKQKQTCSEKKQEEKPETVQQNFEYDDPNDKKKNGGARKSSEKRKSIEGAKNDEKRKSGDVKKQDEMGDSVEKASGGAKGNAKGNRAEKEHESGKGNEGAKGNGGGKRPRQDKEAIGKKGKLCKRKKRGKFVYCMGDKYPGVKVGHKECVTPYFHVPAKMGWLWNVYQPRLWLKPRKGWRPGAIQRTLAARIRAHRQAKGLGMPAIPSFKKKRRGTGEGSDSDIKIAPKPTLQIQKKEGAYWITMNPLKDPYSLEENENPYMDCTPMQFKITKNKNRKKKDGDDDENDESRLCYCEEDMESSSSDSELDIEFTPPAGIIHPERFKKKHNVIHCDTQYDPKDFAVKKKSKDAGKGKGKGGKGGKGKEKGKDKGKPGSKKGKK